MKKIKSLRLASILLIGTLLTTCLLGGTFAKYTTEASGSSSTTVARWSFCANGDEIAISPSPQVKFELFKHAYDDVNDDETDSDIDTSVIAPGTTGKCSLIAKNTGDVSAKYSIALEETNTSGLPIQYSLDNENWVDSIEELSASGLTDQTIMFGDESKSRVHDLYWRWAFEGTEEGAHDGQSDANDTNFGIASEKGSPATVIVTATITASQID